MSPLEIAKDIVVALIQGKYIATADEAGKALITLVKAAHASVKS